MPTSAAATSLAIVAGRPSNPITMSSAATTTAAADSAGQRPSGQHRQRQQLAHADGGQRDRDQREACHLHPDRRRGQPREDDVDDGQRGRRQPCAPQYGGRFSYHSPSTLNAVQNCCLASASFRELSMSGTGSTSIEGVHRWISPGR